jgi:general secretion pathway protein D
MKISDFINLVFGQILKLSYTTGTEVKRSPEIITLNMTEEVNARDLYYVVLDLLEQRGFQVVAQDNLLVIDQVRRNAQKGLFSNNVFWGRKVPRLARAAKITQIVPVYYADLPALFAVAKQFVRDAERLTFEVQNETSSLLVSGPVEEVSQVVKLIEAFDQPFSAGKSIELLYLDYISVKAFLTELENILPGLGIPLSGKGQAAGLRLVPVESLNAVLIVAAQPSWIRSIVYWKQKLDTLQALGDEKNLFVYRPENRPADELMEITTRVVHADPLRKTVGYKAVAEREKTTGPALAALAGLEADISIDKARNALIIYAYPADYKKIRHLLEQLDTPPRQVLIEVTLVEITLTDQLEYGVEWFYRNQGGEFITEISTLGGLGIGNAGLNYALTKVGGDFQALLNAFAQKDLIDIISSPHIVVLDGKEAVIHIGTDVPIIVSETSAPDIETDGASILRNIQYRNTGVILHVRPVVNSGGVLTLEIRQELSDAQQNTTSDISSPLILSRIIDTSLALKSGETVLLGGLISNNRSETVTKVPLLGDIPWLGHLFKVNSESVTKTELIVRVTPYILSNLSELDQLTRSLEGM